ncbi:hypothetical protein Tco_0184171, partial [Tanacetum coccineum]
PWIQIGIHIGMSSCLDLSGFFEKEDSLKKSPWIQIGIHIGMSSCLDLSGFFEKEHVMLRTESFLNPDISITQRCSSGTATTNSSRLKRENVSDSGNRIYHKGSLLQKIKIRTVVVDFGHSTSEDGVGLSLNESS